MEEHHHAVSRAVVLGGAGYQRSPKRLRSGSARALYYSRLRTPRNPQAAIRGGGGDDARQSAGGKAAGVRLELDFLRALRGISSRPLRLKIFLRRGRSGQCGRTLTTRPSGLLHFLFRAYLPFSSTRMMSIPLGPVFSGRCVPAGVNTASPAL